MRSDLLLWPFGLWAGVSRGLQYVFLVLAGYFASYILFCMDTASHFRRPALVRMVVVVVVVGWGQGALLGVGFRGFSVCIAGPSIWPWQIFFAGSASCSKPAGGNHGALSGKGAVRSPSCVADPVWQGRIVQLTYGSGYILARGLFMLVPAFINIIVGNCIPLYTILFVTTNGLLVGLKVLHVAV
ncbi:hypothetical protein DFJ74DRAFT_101093 [Hyaloraphidium curvatum]|nr:hypothetical protein DFJ74DRAFT_101093 [Hyaloraphidium curvatum]